MPFIYTYYPDYNYEGKYCNICSLPSIHCRIVEALSRLALVLRLPQMMATCVLESNWTLPVGSHNGSAFCKSARALLCCSLFLIINVTNAYENALILWYRFCNLALQMTTWVSHLSLIKIVITLFYLKYKLLQSIKKISPSF